MLPDELEDNRSYDPDDDTMDAEKDYSLYSNSDEEKPPDLIDRWWYYNSDNESEDDDDNLLGKPDEDIDEEDLAEVLDSEDFGITVSQIIKTTMIKYNVLGDAYSHDETVWGINDIRWFETVGNYKMVKRDMNAKYNQSNEWRRTYYEWWRT